MAAQRVSAWLPVIAWAAVIFALSSIPGLNTGLGTWDLVLRKLAHAAEAAILAVLVWRATRSEPIALVVSALYFATDELHQSFVPGRVGSITDWAIDLGGIVIALACLRAWRQRSSARLPRRSTQPKRPASLNPSRER